MARSVLLRILLVSGFLLGQWIAVAHAAGHEVLEPGSVHCHVCSLAHAPPVATLPPSLGRITVSHEPVQGHAPVHAAIRIAESPRSRGPPA